MIEDFTVNGVTAFGVFDTSTPYYHFVAKMKQTTPETDVDSWMRDERARFAFNQGYEVGRLENKEHTIYIQEAWQREEKKRNKLVELLKGKGVIVDASGEDVVIRKYE